MSSTPSITPSITNEHHSRAGVMLISDARSDAHSNEHHSEHHSRNENKHTDPGKY